MASKALSEDLISFLKKRDMILKRSNGLVKGENPLIGIISPEWHYSDSIRLLYNGCINWDNLNNFEEVHKVSRNIRIMAKHEFYLPEFEKKYVGWYQPYHFLPRDKWGVHIRYGKWLEISSNLYSICQPLMQSTINASKAGFLYLYYHLIFHHIVENAPTTIEIVTNSHILYERYIKKIYCEFFNSSNCIEESLANCYLVEKVDECRIDRNFLTDSLLNQANGYRDFIHFIDYNFRLGIRRLLSQINRGKLESLCDEPIEQIIDLYNQFDPCHTYSIPIWIHYRAKPLHQMSID